MVVKNLTTELCERYKLASPRQPCKEIRFLTLTLKASADPLTSQIDRLYSSFKSFRNHRKIKHLMPGGIAFLELTRNRQTGMWHPHLHVLFEGGFLPHAIAKSVWFAITKDSYILHIKQIASVGIACGYVAKYSQKGVSANVWADPDALVEAMKALEGRKVFHAFGSWVKFSLARVRDDGMNWIPIMQFDFVVHRAKAGDEDCIRMMHCLLHSASSDDTDLHARSPTPIDDTD